MKHRLAHSDEGRERLPSSYSIRCVFTCVRWPFYRNGKTNQATSFIELKSPSSLSSHALNLQHYQETRYKQKHGQHSDVHERNSVTSEETCFTAAFYPSGISANKKVPMRTKGQVSALTKIKIPSAFAITCDGHVLTNQWATRPPPDPPTLYSMAPRTDEMKRSFNTSPSS